VLNVDTTVQDKAVAFPTDAKLLNKARIALVKLAGKSGIGLRQSCTFVGQQAVVKAGRYAYARQFNRARAQTKKLRGMLGRVIRDMERKRQAAAAAGAQASAQATARMDRLLAIAQRICTQPRVRIPSDPPKIYSVHAPEVECISKGKAHKQYEFGVKVGIVSTNKESFVLAATALPGNPYDGHMLAQCSDPAHLGVPRHRGLCGQGLQEARLRHGDPQCVFLGVKRSRNV
jgi:transposase, IS5 family